MLDVNRLRVIDAVARHGSVTAAAKELHYSQPSVTHHLGRLEAETGAQLLQRVGRGIRLTPAGQLLADRAAEIIGRIDAAGAELSAHVGLNAGRVRLAGFASANGSLVPAAVATLADRHPGLEISLTDTHPLDAIELLRTGKVEVAIIFRYDETEPEPPGVRLHHLLDDPVYVLSTRRERGLATLRDATWIAGCERCRSHLLSICADAGFDPRIGYSSDDMVVMQALVAAGLGVATQTGLSLRAHHIDGVVATELPGSKRHIYAATYGEPPDPPATAALLAALAEAATSAVASLGPEPRISERSLPVTERPGRHSTRHLESGPRPMPSCSATCGRRGCLHPAAPASVSPARPSRRLRGPGCSIPLAPHWTSSRGISRTRCHARPSGDYTRPSAPRRPSAAPLSQLISRRHREPPLSRAPLLLPPQQRRHNPPSLL